MELALSPSPLQVFTDRILLRQILLSLLNYVLHLRGQPRLTVRTELNRSMSICFCFDADEQWLSIQNDERDSLDFARRLSERLPARLDESYPAQDSSGPAEIRLVFTVSKPRTVMVMDDQVAAQRMFQRYLSRTNLEVIGVTDPTQGVEMIRKIQPALLILDVMMPRIDGWEVLQNLQLDPETKHIPIIVCSAWGEPELARSLGAVAFLEEAGSPKGFAGSARSFWPDFGVNMDWFNIPNTDSEYHDLIRSSGEKLIYTVAGLYLIAHIIATLGFPQIFVPRIWGLSLYMLFLVVIVLVLIRRRYFISQVVWLGGLAGAIVLAYFIFLHYEILAFLIVLPLLAVVTMGIPSAAVTTLVVVVIAGILFGIFRRAGHVHGWDFLGQPVHHHVRLGAFQQPAGGPGGGFPSLQ